MHTTDPAPDTPEQKRYWKKRCRAIHNIRKLLEVGREVRGCVAAHWIRQGGMNMRDMLYRGYTGQFTIMTLPSISLLRFVADNNGEWLNINPWVLHHLHVPDVDFYQT